MPEKSPYAGESNEDFQNRMKNQKMETASQDTTNWDNKPVSAEDAESFKEYLVGLHLVSQDVLRSKGWSEEVQKGWENYKKLNEIGMPDSVKAVYAHRESVSRNMPDGARLPAELMLTQYEGTSKIDEYKLWEKYGDDYYFKKDGPKNLDILTDEEYEGVTGEKRVPKEYNIKDIIMNFMSKVK